MPGGSLTSKPAWWNAFGCSITSAFFRVWWRGRNQQGSAFATGIMVQVFLLDRGFFERSVA